ncbi:FixH family protein [Cohnella sp. GCM10027633]|uniref:FixH family protein n=1 Tax=unclassified Cohnella TaxID=2636738 RepID=UPI0036264367
MPAWSKRLLFPCSLAIVIAVMIWQYKASDANAYPVESAYRDDAIEIRVRTEDAPARLMQEATFLIQVNDSSGAPVNDADIHVTIRMPSMFCGEFRAKVAFKGDGAYEAKAVPVMSGRWEAETIVTTGDSSYTVMHRFAAEE